LGAVGANELISGIVFSRQQRGNPEAMQDSSILLTWTVASMV